MWFEFSTLIPASKCFIGDSGWQIIQPACKTNSTRGDNPWSRHITRKSVLTGLRFPAVTWILVSKVYPHRVRRATPYNKCGLGTAIILFFILFFPLRTSQRLRIVYVSHLMLLFPQRTTGYSQDHRSASTNNCSACLVTWLLIPEACLNPRSWLVTAGQRLQVNGGLK